MKLGCGFSIFILLFILQVCAAVKCPYGSIVLLGANLEGTALDNGHVNCKTTCAAYICPNGITGSGCPEDFLADCSNEKSAIDFITRKNLNNMEFHGYGVTYVSGCDKDADVVECVTAKFAKIEKFGKNGIGHIYWVAAKDGSRRK